MVINFNELPSYLRKGRKSVEAVVLGCLFNDILLLGDYDIGSDMFISNDGAFLYRILKTLYDKKITTINDTEIRLNCNIDDLERYKEIGGFKTIETLKRTVDNKNFESYLDDLMKSNYMIHMQIDDGTNLEHEIEIQTKKGIIKRTWLETFKNMSYEEMVNFRERRESDRETVSIDKSIKEHTGAIPDNYLDNLLKGSEIGLMFDRVGDTVFMPYLSKEILGLKRQTLSMLSANVNCGKSTWLSNLVLALASTGNTVLIVTNEQRIEDFFPTFMVYILCNILDYKINKKKIKSGSLSEEDIIWVEKAKDYYNEHFADKIIIASILDTNMNSLNKLVRKYKNSHDIDIVCYDTFKQEFKGDGEASYKDLIKDSRELHTLTKRYDVVGFACIQTSQTYDGELFLTLSMLSGAKAINEILHGLYMMRPLYPQEMNESNTLAYCHPFRRKKVNNKWIEEKVELNPKYNYRVLFISKSRDTMTAVDTREAIIMTFDSFSGTFKEYCMCRPQNRNINTLNNQNKFTKKQG